MAMGKKYEEAMGLVKQVEAIIQATEKLAEGDRRIFPSQNAATTVLVAKLLQDHLLVLARYHDEDYG